MIWEVDWALITSFFLTPNPEDIMAWPPTDNLRLGCFSLTGHHTSDASGAHCFHLCKQSSWFDCPSARFFQQGCGPGPPAFSRGHQCVACAWLSARPTKSNSCRSRRGGSSKHMHSPDDACSWPHLLTSASSRTTIPTMSGEGGRTLTYVSGDYIAACMGERCLALLWWPVVGWFCWMKIARKRLIWVTACDCYDRLWNKSANKWR